MSDLISRQAAIKAVEDLPNCYNGYSDTYDKACIIGVLEELPSAQPDLDEWCADCKEYDIEKHCCPRWNRVIRQTLEDTHEHDAEMKQAFLRMASYVDVLLQCSDEQKETLLGLISRMSEFMPWNERD